jgi:pimeloyl-ACP methyl ester carboxylesterase
MRALDDRPLVLINGLGVPHFVAEVYARFFREDGRRVFAVSPPSLGFGDLRAAARRVDEAVGRALAETGAAKVDLVGMSLGGLIGLYYVRCAGGAPRVARFVSVGGPLNGSRLACVGRIPPLTALPSLSQICALSDFVREVQTAPREEEPRMYTVGTRGDFVTPRSLYAAEGLEPIETPHGFFPLGHWLLFLHPGNRRVVMDLLDGG